MSVFGNILRGLRGEPAPQAANAWMSPKPDRHVYIVGDIHGQAEAFDQLLEVIDVDMTQRGIEDPVLVLVGDYIDRGDGSAQVLARIWEMSQELRGNLVCLRGNHEKMMLDFVQRPRQKGRRWIKHGGLQTIASFGVGGMVTPSSSDEDLAGLSDAFKAAMPRGMLDWINSLPTMWQSGDLVVVHAAMDPARSLGMQTERDLLWGTRSFFEQEREDGLWVAHGHTVVEQPSAAAGRIAVDTGAVFGGPLTAASVCVSGEIDFLQAKPHPRKAS